ncbi:hypothetical protein [Halobacterium salinarum]|uniref:hypothetical protein n=1 Tax=Halobacterium salinarum TaxID=2242 RepID=UPI003BB17F40
MQAYDLQFFVAGEFSFRGTLDDNLSFADMVCYTPVLNTKSRYVNCAIFLIKQKWIKQETLTRTSI